MMEHRGFLTTVLAAFVASNTGPAMAQSSSRPPSSELEQVTVTGSRIVTNGNEQPTPVTVATQEQLSQFTPKSIADAVIELPALVSSSSRSSSGPGTTVGQTYLNLRSLGGTRNLVLMDGHRLVGSQANGQFDVNLIPQQLVKRVEVVTGGASAAYGSDAVAGVTNFILDTSFTGIKGTASSGVTKYSDDRTHRASLAVGEGFMDDRLHVIASVDWMKSDGAKGFAVGGPVRGWQAKRNFLMNNPNVTAANPKSPSNPRLIPGYDVRYPYATNGGMIPSGPLRGTQFLPDGSAVPFKYGSSLTNGFMMGGDGGSSGGTWSLDLPIDSHVLFTHLNFDVSDDWTVYAEGQYSRAKTTAITGTVYSALGTQFTIFQDNAYLPADLRSRMLAANIPSFPMGRIHMDFGPYARELKNGMTRGQLGAKGTFGESWSWDVSYEHGKSFNDYYGGGGNFRTENLYRAADAVVDPVTQKIVCRSTLTHPGDGCVPINLFGDGAPSAAALAYVKGTSYALTDLTSKILSGQVSGDAFSNWAGAVKVAFGFTHREDAFTQNADPQGSVIKTGDGIRGFPAAYRGTEGMYQFGNVHSGSGSFTVNELFGETQVPLLRELPGAEALDLNAAVRLTKYSTVGRVNTWKVGLTYTPVHSLRLRGTVSQDIRAPGLDELYMSSPTGNLSVIDTITGSGNVSQAQITSPGNPNLQEEEAKTVTFGLVYTSAWLQGFSVALDYYDIRIDGAIGRLSGQDIVDLCAKGDAETCSLIGRAGGTISTINSLALNMDELETSGIDLELAYAPPVPVGDLSFRVLGNYVDKFKTTSRTGTSRDSSDTTPKRLNVMADYRIGKVGIAVRERMIGERKISDFYTPSDLANNHIDTQWYSDLTLTYHPGGETDNLQLFLNISNLLDNDPPTGLGEAIGARPETNNTYDALGRYYTAGVRFNFRD